MRLSSLGAACSSFAVVQAEITGMLLDNGTMSVADTLNQLGTLTASGNIRWCQYIEITSEPDAQGRVPVMAGKLLMVPRIAGTNVLQFLDPVTGAITASSLIIPNYTTNPMFSCGVTLPNNLIQLVPWTNPQFCNYDPYEHTLVAGITHGRTSSNTVPAFGGACVGKDGLAWYTPGHAADKAMCKFDYLTNSFAVTAITLPYSATWQTTNHGGSLIPLPNGDLLALTSANPVMGAPWRIKPSTGTVSNAVLTGFTSTTGAIMLGGVLSIDGQYVVLVESISNKIRVYRLSDNALIDAVFFTTLPANTWSGAALMSDGRVCFIGNGFGGFGLFNPADFKVVLGKTAATGTLTATGNFADGETVGIAGKTYTFKTVLSATNGYVLIGADAAASLSNLAAAVVRGPGDGTLYAGNTTLNADASAVAVGNVLTVTAIQLGTVGNGLATVKTAANASWGAATMSGGVNLGDFTGVPGFGNGGASNTLGGRSIGVGDPEVQKIIVLPGTAINTFLSWQYFASGNVPKSVRKSRYYDRK